MNASAPNSVRLPDIMDPSESLLYINQLRQNLYLLLRIIENDRSSDETFEQSKVVANTLSSFKKEAALLPVVSGTREHQNKRVAQLWRAIRMKDAFFKRLTKRRPRKKPIIVSETKKTKKKSRTKKPKSVRRWVEFATLKARRKRQIDIFQGKLQKAPKTEENENTKKKKIYFEDGVKIPRVWRLKKKVKKRKSKKIKDKEIKSKKLKVPAKSKKSASESPIKFRKRKDKKSNKKKKKNVRQRMAFDAPAKFLEKNGYQNKYKDLVKLRRLLLQKDDKTLSHEVKEIDSKRRKVDEDNCEHNENNNSPTTKWNYFRPQLKLHKSPTIVQEDNLISDPVPKVNATILSNAHVDGLREEKLIELDSDTPNTVIVTNNFEVSKLRIPRQALTFSNVDPDLASVFNEMDLI